MKSCEVCNCKKKNNRYYQNINMILCQKHYRHYVKYGEFLDDKPYTKRDKNIYEIYNDYVVMNFFNIDSTLSDVKCIIDKDDYEKCKKYKWSYVRSGYFITKLRDQCLSLHRFIVGAPDNMCVDHINGDTFNNRKSNLRICDHQNNTRNLHKHRSLCGVIGVRRDLRCKNSWRAQIYIDKNKKLEKTYKDYKKAVVQRLIWELEYFNEFSPQIELIKNNYSYLLNYLPVQKNMRFNNVDTVIKIGDLLFEDSHCPCMINKNDDTVCPCLPCREKKHCHCGMFVPRKMEDENVH